MKVALYNPLPAALAHYCLGVRQILSRLGVEHDLVVSSSVEAGTAKGTSFVSRSLHAVQERQPLRGRDVLAVWPAFADLDPAVWAVARPASVTLVWHDPVPIRRTRGSHPLARAVGQRAQRHTDLSIVVHSERARADLEQRGWRVATSVAHPYVDTSAPSVARTATALVAGQYKPERDLAILEGLAPRLAAAGLVPRIVGPGWPEVPGWHVERRFVPEAELDRELASAAVVLLPYQRVYQSGVAVRAAEMGTPVVGRADTNVPEIFGEDWPGLVDAESCDVSAWQVAVEGTIGIATGDTARRVESWKRTVDASWDSFVRARGWSLSTSITSPVHPVERRT